MQKITTCLWFDSNAEEAVNFYTSVFPDSRITAASYYGKEGPGPEGTVMEIGFELQGQAFAAINGGPHFSFTPAISLMVNCRTQDEVDRYWEVLSEGGSKQRCGWVQDKYGLSWQIVPAAMIEMMQSRDPAQRGKVMEAMLKMEKLDIGTLQQAYESADR